MKSKLKARKIVLIALAVVLVIATALIVCFSLPKGGESVKFAGSDLTTTVSADNLPKTSGGQCADTECKKTTVIVQNQSELAAIFKIGNVGGGTLLEVFGGNIMNACYRVNFVTEHMFTDISLWKENTLGNITAGNLLPFTGHFDFAGMMLKSSNSASGVFQNIGENGIVENVKCDFTDSRLAHTSSGIIRNISSRNTYSASAFKNTGGILYLNNGTVSNATVWAEAASGVDVLNYNRSGGIAHYNGGIIEDCIFYGANIDSTARLFGGIALGANAVSTEVGDVVTFTKGIFKSCRVYMPQNKSFLVDGYFGGIIAGSGTNGAYIENCTANIRITGSKTLDTFDPFNYIGGIAGYIKAPAVIKNCSSSGTINDVDRKFINVGGVVGSAWGADRAAVDKTKKQVQISGCESAISITAKASVGGILGKGFLDTDMNWLFSLSITNCKNRGSISGNNNIAGIVGEINTRTKTNTISDCTNYGDLTTNGSKLGGLVGDYANSGGILKDSVNYGNILGTGGSKGGFVGTGSDTVYGELTISGCTSYAEIVDVGTAGNSVSLAGWIDTVDKFINCKVREIDNKKVYFLGGVEKSVATGVVEYLTGTSVEKPKPEVVKTVNIVGDVIEYQLVFNTDSIPAGTKIYSYKISVDGGSYFTQLIHKEYVLCKIDTAKIASSIEIGTGAGQYSQLTFTYNALTTKENCMVLIRLSNNREYYL